jgi:hypothetical protein
MVWSGEHLAACMKAVTLVQPHVRLQVGHDRLPRSNPQQGCSCLCTTNRAWLWGHVQLRVCMLSRLTCPRCSHCSGVGLGASGVASSPRMSSSAHRRASASGLVASRNRVQQMVCAVVWQQADDAGERQHVRQHRTLLCSPLYCGSAPATTHNCWQTPCTTAKQSKLTTLLPSAADTHDIDITCTTSSDKGSCPLRRAT